MSKAYTYEYVKNYIEVESNRGYILLENEYKNNMILMKMICNNGHFIEKSFSSFLIGKGCWECHIENNKGSNSNSWNSNLSEEDRLYRRSLEGYDNWKYSVYERDKYICQHCGNKCGKNIGINAHHMDGYNWCKERRLDISNGVTLCNNCHTLFHRLYGYGNNTEIQFFAWIIESGSGIFDIDDVKNNSVLKIKPEKQILYEKQEYFKEYYNKNIREYSEDELDIIFKEILLENTELYYLTTKGFEEVSGVNPMVYTQIFKMNWLDVLGRYNKKDELIQYIVDEYLKYYLQTYDSNIRNFYMSHKYITQQLIKLITENEIKSRAGFNNALERHNLIGLRQNFNDIINKIDKIPFRNEFMENTKIPINAYLLFFKIENYSYDEIVKNLVDDNKYNIYIESTKHRIKPNYKRKSKYTSGT
jgi:hypothetical protein